MAERFVTPDGEDLAVAFERLTRASDVRPGLGFPKDATVIAYARQLYLAYVAESSTFQRAHDAVSKLPSYRQLCLVPDFTHLVAPGRSPA